MQNIKQPRDKTIVWCITPNGFALAKNLAGKLDKAAVFASKKLKSGPSENKQIQYFDNLSDEIQNAFGDFKQHIFIFSVGIAVRMIGPLLESKLSDPAVVVVDDKGTFAVSLVSGHLGGANELAQKTAELLNATPVITTATDANDLPAIDMIAKESGCRIEAPENIKRVNMAILKGDAIRIYDPGKFIFPALEKSYSQSCCQEDLAGSDIYCSYKIHSVPRETLVLRPPVLYVGVGCNRNTSSEQIRDFLLSVMDHNNLAVGSIASLATSDVKKDEKGLLAFAGEMNLPLHFYNKNALNSVQGVQNPSVMAEKHLGVTSVSEAAAILSSKGGSLIVEKQKNRDVTVAVAVMK